MLSHLTTDENNAAAGASRSVIVNADDFGQSHGVNQGVMKAHAAGIVTSASLMVRWPAAHDAVAYARHHPSLSLGIHIDLGEQVFRAGEWIPLYVVVALDDAIAVAAEVSRQLEQFRCLMGREPSHIDSHQHVHLREPMRTVLIEVARQLQIPLRHCSPAVCYCGSFYGQTAEGAALPNVISVDGLLRILENLPPGRTEIGCHPAAWCDLNTMYRDERLEELSVLCDPRLRAAITSMGIKLCSFADLPSEHQDSMQTGAV